ncbi:hypothetical protein MWU65_08645 [Cellulophaga sp. F20128]|nr:hypothetical protein [Cellulophaga sp. F20128]MCK0157241.1 hypothetical protein [Cellulophaga sp. F20128]
MKAITTLLFVLFIGFFAQAQDVKESSVLETETKEVTVSEMKKDNVKETNKVARLYKFKNSKIKKELAFDTKRSKSKIA